MRYIGLCFKNLLLAYLSMSFLFSSLCMYLLDKIDPRLLDNTYIQLGKQEWSFSMNRTYPIKEDKLWQHVDEVDATVAH